MTLTLVEKSLIFKIFLFLSLLSSSLISSVTWILSVAKSSTCSSHYTPHKKSRFMDGLESNLFPETLSSPANWKTKLPTGISGNFQTFIFTAPMVMLVTDFHFLFLNNSKFRMKSLGEGKHWFNWGKFLYFDYFVNQPAKKAIS